MKLINTLSRIFKRNPTGDLKHITDAVDNAINTVANDIKLLDLEFIIGSSTGEWLDEWGSWFGVPRLLGEKDELYRNRILAIATKPKNTAPALIEAVRTYLDEPNLNVIVYEPYLNIRKFNISTFSGEDKYQDAVYQRFGVVDIIIPTKTPGIMQNVVQPIKSAGVKVYFTRVDIIGEGAPIYTGPDHAPWTNQYIESDLSIKLTDLPIFSGPYLWKPRSGRKVSFDDIVSEFQLQSDMRRKIIDSSNTVIDSIYNISYEDLDNYFNAVSYDKESEIKIIIDKINVYDEIDKETNLFVLLSPDIFTSSCTSMSDYIDRSIDSVCFQQDDYLIEFTLQADARRKIVGSSNTVIDHIYNISYEDLSDEYFNAVSYDKETDLSQVATDAAVADDGVDKETNLAVLLSPDLFANSRTPLNILYDRNIKELYFHDDDYEIETNMLCKYRRLYTGSAYPMKEFLDTPIDLVDDTYAYSFDKQLGIVSKTMPA